jgi:hydrogenase expression/formation protein HypE
MSGPTCPIPLDRYPVVTLAHGSGGRLMNRLIEELFVAELGGPSLQARHDASVLPRPEGRMAITTDSFVVTPLFFPGGDIGSLAVTGTVNDLAMAGAIPRWMSLGVILEEGFDMEALWRIVRSIRTTAVATGVEIVTGDTKVVERGKGDGVFLNTTGVGIVPEGREVAPTRVRSGDAVIVSGDIGRHGMAVMALREGLAFDSEIRSDCAPLVSAVTALFDAGVDVRCLRDLTRGGLLAASHEIADAAGVTLRLDEAGVPVADDVAGACEILGLDPVSVACEGRFLAVVAAADADRACSAMAGHPGAPDPRVAGAIEARDAAPLVMATRLGQRRILDLPQGELLPRIC